jgi:tetratricopeptide (TPR) repeat protein
LRKDATVSAAERDEAERRAAAERAAAAMWMPNRWIEQAQRERAAGNEELAIRVLDEGFERVRRGMARTGLALAGHHLSLIVGSNPLVHLEEGERLARVSALLDPEDADAAFLVEDAELARTSGELEGVSSLSASFIPGDPEEAGALVKAINSKTADYADAGHYRLALRLFRRSLLLIRRGGMMEGVVGHQVQRKVAECLMFCGRYQEARENIELLLARLADMLPAHDEEIFFSKVVLSDVTAELGDPHQALAILTDAISAFASVAGEDDRHVLVARAQQASFLISAGQPQQALDASERLLPRLVQLYGPRHSNVFATQLHVALALAQLERNQEALENLASLLPRQIESMGEDHPSVLVARKQEAEILFELGQLEQALLRVDAVIADMERIHGAEHPHVAKTQELRDAILDATAA